MRYSIRIARDAGKALAALSPEIKRRITLAIDSLAVEPRPHGAKALAGRSGLLRIRVGDYRVVYGVTT